MKIYVGEICCSEGIFELHERYVATPSEKGGYYFMGTREEYVGEGGGSAKTRQTN